MRSWCWPWGSPTRAVRWAEETDFKFFKAVIPVLGATGEEQFALPPRYTEWINDSTNGLWQATYCQPNATNMPPGMLDWACFIDPMIGRDILNSWRGCRHIAHSFKSSPSRRSGLVLICPELEITPQQIVGKCQTIGFDLVLSAKHLARERGSYSPNRDNPHPFFPTSEGHRPDYETIEMVVDLWAPFVRVVEIGSVDKDSIDHDVATALITSPYRRDELDFIADYEKLLASPRATRRYMADFLAGMRQLVEGSYPARQSPEQVSP